jgi:oxygen-dependent protoporphyrinogen oxidase
MTYPDSVIIGGGITGLVAAHHLSRAGARVTLLEDSDRLGGMVRTEHDDGYLIESGPDSFVAGKGSVLALCDYLGITGEVISSRPEHRGSYVWWHGRLHPLPGGLLLMVPTRMGSLFGSDLLSWRGKIRALGDLGLPRRRAGGDESLESFVTRRLGREVLERIAEPLVAGIHAAEPETMSLRASFPRFLEMEDAHRSLILAARRAATFSSQSQSHFASLGPGMGRLIDVLAMAMGDVDVRRGTPVLGIEREGHGRFRLILADGDLTTQNVILAVPAPVASSLLSRVAPEAAAAVQPIDQAPGATVTLAYEIDTLPPLPGSGFVVPAAQRRRISGVSFLNQKWEGRVPDDGYALIRVYVRRTEEDLRAVAMEELDEMIGVHTNPVRSWAHRWEHGLHRYTLGHLERVAEAESHLGAGLFLAGGGFHGIGLNECVDSGMKAADRVLDNLSNAVTVTGSGEPH